MPRKTEATKGAARYRAYYAVKNHFNPSRAKVVVGDASNYRDDVEELRDKLLETHDRSPLTGIGKYGLPVRTRNVVFRQMDAAYQALDDLMLLLESIADGAEEAANE